MESIIKNTFQWLVKKLENAERLNVLKTVSRFFGLIVFALSSVFIDVLYISLALAATVILVSDITFFICGMKESNYKSKPFFQEQKITPVSLDRYTLGINALKLVLLVPLVFNLMLTTYLFLCPLMVIAIAYFTGYKPYIPHASTADEKPWYYGKGGFGIAGNYTGELGSVGGQSG
ncbi:MAG TPA: hypothetical protein DD412_03740 [Holosporales bacterium]|nr:hypothetical protein [Holosporales bacterium]